MRRTEPLRHVLVIDDQPDLCETVRLGLEEVGRYRVSSVISGQDAMPLLDSDRPSLVVVNAVLPGIPGIEVAAQAARRDIPALVMTDDAAMDIRLERMGWPHLRKPFQVQQLLEEVHNTIGRAHENARIIRASLDRLFQTSGDLARAIDALQTLRRRIEETLARSRRLDNGH